jgi:translation initiation factor 1
VRIRRETKGRGGKTVTSIQGLQLDKKGLSELCKILKRRCGTGGAVKQGVIEIQGDWVEILLEELHKRGFTTKRSGG